jgi:phage/plasmid-associated DNA primase
VTASESSDKVRLNEARIKALTGRDPITARAMYENEFTFEPAAKYWLSTNHKPTVQDDSEGFWRRMHLVPYLQCFKGREDHHLKDTLRREAAGILAWLVQGALRWRQDGLHPPEMVKAATEEYRRENEPLTPFLDACTENATGARVKASDLFAAYTTWCAESGFSADSRLNQTTFGRQMKKRFDAVEERHTFYIGLRLSNSTDCTSAPVSTTSPRVSHTRAVLKKSRETGETGASPMKTKKTGARNRPERAGERAGSKGRGGISLLTKDAIDGDWEEPDQRRPEPSARVSSAARVVN